MLEVELCNVKYRRNGLVYHQFILHLDGHMPLASLSYNIPFNIETGIDQIQQK